MRVPLPQLRADRLTTLDLLLGDFAHHGGNRPKTATSKADKHH